MNDDVNIIDDDQMRKDAAAKKGLPETATWADIDQAEEKSLDKKDVEDLHLPIDATEDTINAARDKEAVDEIEGKEKPAETDEE